LAALRQLFFCQLKIHSVIPKITYLESEKISIDFSLSNTFKASFKDKKNLFYKIQYSVMEKIQQFIERFRNTLSTPVEFDFTKMANKDAVTAGFDNTKYDLLSPELMVNFDTSLTKLGLKFSPTANGDVGAIVKIGEDDNALDELELTAIKENITASTQLFDVDFLLIAVKLPDVKLNLTRAVQTLESTIKSQEEKDSTIITEKQKKVSKYESDMQKIDQISIYMDNFYKQLEEDMKALNEMFDNILKSIGLGNNDN
jgi:hypothetical protein